MRKLFVLFPLLTLSLVVLSAPPSRIEHPSFVYQGRYGLGDLVYSGFIYRGHHECTRLMAIERRDTATVVELQYTPFYCWTRFDATVCLRDEQGRHYYLRRIGGDYDIAVGQHFTVPEKRSFLIRLVFPPLPKRVRTIDLTETGGRGEWGFFGIRLDGKPLPTFSLPKEVERKLAALPVEGDTLPIPALHYGMATVRGHLLEYRPGMKHQVCLRIGSSGFDVGEINDTVLATVSPQGDFCVQVPLARLTPIDIPLGDQTFLFYAEPNRETEIYVNMRELSSRRQYWGDKIQAPLAYVTAGPLARLANEWNQRLRRDQEMTMKNFREQVYGTNDFEQWPFQELAPGKLYRKALEWMSHHRPDSVCSPQLKTLLALNDSLLFIRYVSFLSTIVSLREKQRQQHRPAAGADHRAWERWAHEWGEGRDDRDTLELGSIDACLHMMRNPRQLLCPALYDQFVSLESLPVRLPDYVENELKAYRLMLQLQKLMPLDSLQQEQNFATLPAAYQDYLQRHIDRLDRLTEDNRHQSSYHIHELFATADRNDPNKLLAAEDSLLSLRLDSLIAPYRGHPVYVQMWQPHSNYSVRLNRYGVIPMQQRLEGTAAVFVFLTDCCYTSNWDFHKWTQMIPQLRGHHYPLTQKLYRNIAKSLTGDDTVCDRFFVFDAQGRMVYATKAWNEAPDFDEIERLLREGDCPQK